MIYNCPYCLKQYTRKINFDYHLPICKINSSINKSISEKKTEEEENENINFKELVIILKELVVKNNKLEERVKRLENENIKIIEINNKRINKLEYLNKNYTLNRINFKEFIEQLKINQTDLEIVFKDGIFKGLNHLFNSLFENNIDIEKPIVNFKSDKNLYIYKNENWEICDYEDYCFIINCLLKKIIGLFIDWKKANHDKIINDDEMGILANQYQIKVFGNGKNIKENYMPFDKKINKHIPKIDFVEIYNSNL